MHAIFKLNHIRLHTERKSKKIFSKSEEGVPESDISIYIFISNSGMQLNLAIGYLQTILSGNCLSLQTRNHIPIRQAPSNNLMQLDKQYA